MTPQQLQAYWAQNPQALAQAIESNPQAFGLDARSASDQARALRAKYEAGLLTAPQEEQFLRIHGSRTGVDPSTLNQQELWWAYGQGQPDTNGMGNDGGQRNPTNTGPSPSNGLPGPGGPPWSGPADAPSPVTLWDQYNAPTTQAPGVQTPDWGTATGQSTGPFPTAPNPTQQPGVGPANGMDNFNNAAHSTWKSQYETMMQDLNQNVQNQQNIYPVGPRATRYGLMDEEQMMGLLN